MNREMFLHKMSQNDATEHSSGGVITASQNKQEDETNMENGIVPLSERCISPFCDCCDN